MFQFRIKFLIFEFYGNFGGLDGTICIPSRSVSIFRIEVDMNEQKKKHFHGQIETSR